MQNYISKSKIILVIILIILIFAVSIFIFRPSGNGKNAEALDSFALCLTDKGWTMYGAYWCPHCQNEKAAFGDSFKYVNYIECTEKPDICTKAGIKGFPTWITDDGRRFEGEQGVAGLAKESMCSLDAAKNDNQ